MASPVPQGTSFNSKLRNGSPHSQIASYLNNNQEENGYVFDGVKIDVISSLNLI